MWNHFLGNQRNCKKVGIKIWWLARMETPFKVNIHNFKLGQSVCFKTNFTYHSSVCMHIEIEIKALYFYLRMLIIYFFSRFILLHNWIQWRNHKRRDEVTWKGPWIWYDTSSLTIHGISFFPQLFLASISSFPCEAIRKLELVDKLKIRLQQW